MLLKKSESVLVLVDVQQKLTPLVLNAEKIVAKLEWMLRLANRLGVPTLITEQYPRGLGETLPSLKECVTASNPPIEKVSFSCYKEPLFQKTIHSLSKKQTVLMGIETHVCILQTALDLRNPNNEVFVVVDAVSSRSEMDHRYALKRMKQAGVHLVTSEMVFFEWLEHAGTAEFKALSQSFLR